LELDGGEAVDQPLELGGGFLQRREPLLEGFEGGHFAVAFVRVRAVQIPKVNFPSFLPPCCAVTIHELA